MKPYKESRLSTAIHALLSLGLLSAGYPMLAQAADDQAADQAPDTSGKSSTVKQLDAVSVTGSLLRRVDKETANPVVTVNAEAIANNGEPTVGKLLQQLPSFAGSAANTSNNSNGGGVASPTKSGGDGAARISLRGLGSERTLVLIDGQRLINADLNMIPQNMIERIDVLNVGASTVYGSDAIGGVVNVILKKDYQGADISVNSGISSHGDGQRHGFNFTAGAANERGEIAFGMSYNKYDPILATRRKFSEHQLYLYNGGPEVSGSSTIPTGYVQVPGSIAQQYGCTLNANGYGVLTRASGDGSSLDDYRCYRGNTDTYNYNAYNYIQTEQQRVGSFLTGHYDLTDNVTVYGTVMYNHTTSAGQDAPPGVYVTDGWNISSSSPANPFGIDFSADDYNFKTRLTGIGTRLHTFTTDNVESIFGVRGYYGQSSWSWDANANYGLYERTQYDHNEISVSKLQTLLDNGLNLFDQDDPTVVSQLEGAAETAKYRLLNKLEQVQFTSNGNLWELPAGPVQLSVGALYRHTSTDYTVSADAQLDTTTLTCNLIQEACGSPGSGSYNVKEVFAESLIPLLSEKPWAYSLNLDVGIRTSRYSTSGTTTNKKLAVEWRPVRDLLVRGTASEIFRAPNVNELYDGVTISNPTVNDPCVNLTSSELAAHSTACAAVAPGWTGGTGLQINALYSGSDASGLALKPEKGKSFDFGFVYSPSELNGFSTSVDLWHIYLDNLLTTLAAQTVLDSCFASEASEYCSFIHRYPSSSTSAGQIYYVNTPVVNLGTLSTSGVDLAVNYLIPHFDLGRHNPGDFKLSLNTTYLAGYKNNATPGSESASVIDYAGTYSQQFGNLTRLRGSLTLDWKRTNWDAQWLARYVHGASNLGANLDTAANVPIASVVYHSLQAGYQVPDTPVRFDIGVDNVFNKNPPLVYQNGSDYNVDTSTYDTIGRYYWARVSAKF
jgi:outer membrane receptor protein involved in Fe transport